MKLTVLPGSFAVCRLEPRSPVPAQIFAGSFASATRTESELSLVCEERFAPAGAKAETGWRTLRVAGPLAFSLTGILAELSGVLADAGVSLFSVSTFDTDYLLVREGALATAISALRRGGHDVEGAPE